MSTLFAAVASMINAPDEEIAIPAARSVLYSRFRKKNKRELRNIMQHEKRNSVRKAYLESVATSLGRDYMKLVKAPSGEVLDFQTKLTDELIRNVIAVINREIDRHFRAKNLFFDQVGWSDVQELNNDLHKAASFERFQDVKDRFIEMAEEGVPFVFGGDRRK